MRIVTKWFVAGTSAAAKEDGFFSFYDPSVGTDQSKPARNLQGASFIYFKYGVKFIHTHPDYSENPILRWVPSQ
jgi:hypothetical protein